MPSPEGWHNLIFELSSNEELCFTHSHKSEMHSSNIDIQPLRNKQKYGEASGSVHSAGFLLCQKIFRGVSWFGNIYDAKLSPFGKQSS